jgi:hypothetical protein
LAIIDMQIIPKRSWRHRLGAITSPTTLDSDISPAFPDEASEHWHLIAKVRDAAFRTISTLFDVVTLQVFWDAKGYIPGNLARNFPVFEILRLI